MPVKSTGIPDVPYGIPTKEILDPIKETMEVMTGVRGGNKLGAVPTFQDLVDLGLITADQVPK